MNKAAQQLAKKSVKVQKKKFGKNYNKEMSRRIKTRWEALKSPQNEEKTEKA